MSKEYARNLKAAGASPRPAAAQGLDLTNADEQTRRIFELAEQKRIEQAQARRDVLQDARHTLDLSNADEQTRRIFGLAEQKRAENEARAEAMRQWHEESNRYWDQVHEAQVRMQSPAMRSTIDTAVLAEQAAHRRMEAGAERPPVLKRADPVEELAQAARRQMLTPQGGATRESVRRTAQGLRNRVAAVEAAELGREANRLQAMYENMAAGGYEDPELQERAARLREQATQAREDLFDRRRNLYAGYTQAEDYTENSRPRKPEEYDPDWEIINGQWAPSPKDANDRTAALQQMSEEERELYNYLYNTEGKASADAFVEFMKETLNYREGAARFERMNVLQKAASPIQSGVQQFGTGMQTLLTGKQTAATPDQYAAQRVREQALWAGKEKELAEYRQKMNRYILSRMDGRSDVEEPEAPKPSALGKLLQAGVDMGTTVGNMLPSILVSSLTGGMLSGAVEAGTITAAEASRIAGLAGSATLGASAGGNAFNEALKEGWTRDQAGMYGLLVGASEAGMQYALGGITKLGGGAMSDRMLSRMLEQAAHVDSAAARFALSFGARMVAAGHGEGLEEGLQELLEPAFRSMIAGEEYHADAGDVAYSYLMGFASAFIFEAGDAWRAAKMPPEFQAAAGRQTLEGYMGPDGVDWFEGCETEQDVRKRFRELAKQHHEDAGGDKETMQRINVQHEIWESFFKGQKQAGPQRAAETAQEAGQARQQPEPARAAQTAQEPAQAVMPTFQEVNRQSFAQSHTLQGAAENAGAGNGIAQTENGIAKTENGIARSGNGIAQIDNKNARPASGQAESTAINDNPAEHTQAAPVQPVRLGETFEQNQNGGMTNGAEGTEPAEAGGQAAAAAAKGGNPETEPAEAGAGRTAETAPARPEDGRSALPDADAGRRNIERPGKRAERVPEDVRQRGGSRQHRQLTQQRQERASLDPMTSPRAAGVPNGAETQICKTFRNEADWDPEIREGVRWAREQGVDVVPMLGPLQIEKDGRTATANGVFDRRTGTVYVRADAATESFSELLEHEVGHWKTTEQTVQAFMNGIKRDYREAAWRAVYDAYRRKYARLTDNYAGMTEAQAELYVWEEILADAYADANRYGTQASVYGAEADAALSTKTTAREDTARPAQSTMTDMREPAEQTTRGPPEERFSVEDEGRKERQLEIIRRSNPAPNSYQTWVRSTADIHTLEEAINDPDWDYDEYDPDWTRGMAEQALARGSVTVYSSYPIKNGVFVTPSQMEAESYAGDGKLYKKQVSPEDVAWIDPTQGQYAADESEQVSGDDIRYSADEDDVVPEGYSSMDDYANRLKTEREQMRQEFMRNKSREEFEGTPAMQKLGVKVAGSVGVYQFTQSIIENARAAKSIQKATRKAEIRLDATDAEKSFAHGIVAGLYEPDDIPNRLDADTVMELADYYNAETLTKNSRLFEQRKTIQQHLEEKMQALFGDLEIDKVKPLGMIRLNHGTPLRNMERMFGREKGRQIFDELFRPVEDNEAERLRFVNRMFDTVRKFKDRKGKTRGLTKAESALVQKVIEGRAAGELAASLEMHGAIENAAQNIRNGEDAGDAAREFGLSQNERELAQQVARWLDTQEELKTADTTIIEAAVKAYPKQYQLFYDALNDFLAAHGYEPIGFIKGYAPHMQPEETTDLLGKALKSFGINTEVTQLPSSISGKTAQFRPNKRWNPFFLSRSGSTTEYDIVKGYEKYVDYMSDVLFHTDDVMRIRAAERYFRKTFAPEETRNLIEQAEALRYASPEQKESFLRAQNEIDAGSALSPEAVTETMEAFIEKQYQNVGNMTRFSDLAMWLDNYANILAGKQSMADRGREYELGRKSLNIPSKIMRIFGQANVAGNLSSALNQVAQWPMIQAEVGIRWTLQALRDVATGQITRGGWREQSDFLTEKKGEDRLRTEPAEKVISAMFKPAELTDTLLSTVAVRARYLKEIHAGKSHAEAMRAADDFGRSIMASRAKGSKPMTFHSKTLLNQMKNIFQIECLNSWEHIAHDLMGEAAQIEKEQGRVKAAGWVAGILVKALLGSFLLNRLTEELYGGTPAPFDALGMLATFFASGNGLATNEYLETIIDNGLEKMMGERPLKTDESALQGDFDTKQAVEDVTYNVLNDVPFVRNIAGIAGVGDQTVPMPQVGKKLGDLWNALSGKQNQAEQAGDALLGAITEIIPGGRQIRKTVQGLTMQARGGEFTRSGLLKYPARQDVYGIMQNALFGKYASREAQSYYAGGSKYLTQRSTTLWRQLVEGGMSPTEAYDYIRNMNNMEPTEGKSRVTDMQRLREIAAADIPEDKKLEMIGTIMGTETETQTGNKTQWAKMQELMDHGFTLDEALDVKEYDYMDKVEKLIAAKAQGVTPKIYNQARNAIEEVNDNTNVSMEEARSGIDTLSIPKEQKAILWQMMNASWNPEKNPFDVAAAKRYLAELNGEPKLQGLSLPTLPGVKMKPARTELRGLSLPRLEDAPQRTQQRKEVQKLSLPRLEDRPLRTQERKEIPRLSLPRLNTK